MNERKFVTLQSVIFSIKGEYPTITALIAAMIPFVNLKSLQFGNFRLDLVSFSLSIKGVWMI